MDLKALGIETHFSVLDWCIIVVYLTFIVSIGVYIRRYISNVTDFIVAGRALKTLLAIATMIGTELGLVTVMYAAQKGFTGGFAAFHIALAAAIVSLTIGLTGFIVVPLRRMRVMTIPEFYQKRFGRGVQILGGAILAFSGILNMGLFLKAGALFVMGITHLGLANVTADMTLGIELKIIMSILLGLVLLYTTLGGMVSVVILDYIQFVILSFSFLITALFAINRLGMHNIIDGVSQVLGDGGFNPFHAKGFGVPYVVWMFFGGFVSCAVWQTAVIRACAAESTRIVKKLYIWSSIGFLIRFLIPCFFGICALVYINQNETLRGIFLPQSGPAPPDITMMAMPVLFSQILPIGLIGFIAAGMMAAFMSTHDSYLLCWSSVMTQDVVAPWFKKDLSSETRVLLTRIFIVAIGGFILFWGLWYPLEQDLWDYMLISGAIYFNGAFALLAFGLYWKRASKVGAYLALACGFFAIVGLAGARNSLFRCCSFLGLETTRAQAYINDMPTAKLSAIVGLAVVGLAIVFMIVGSLLFPDKRPAFNHNDHYRE